MQRVIHGLADVSRGAYNAAVYLEDEGARLDGAAADDDALDRGIARAAARGGGRVCWQGTLGIAAAHDVPTGVTLWGGDGASRNAVAGAAGSTVKALAAPARLRFGAQGVGSTGGASGHFLLDGNQLAPTMLYLGRTLERSFHNVSVKNCVAGEAAVVIEEAQNNQFFGLALLYNNGDGIRFDRGCAGNRFYGTEGSNNGIAGGVHVRFTATAAGVLAVYPSNNQFFGGIFERDGGLLDAIVYHGAGADNLFWGVNLAGGGATRDFPLVKMEVGNAGITGQSTRLTFHGCYFTGDQSHTTVFDLDDASIVRVFGWPLIQGHKSVYLLRDASSRVYLLGDPVVSNVTNTLDPSSVGTLSAGVATPIASPSFANRVIADNGLTVGFTDNNGFLVESDAGTDLFNVNTNGGVVQLVNGADLTIFAGNYASPVFAVDAATGVQYFGAIGTSTPSIRTGSGTPEGAVTAPVGSLYLRTDGGAATSVYVKESGVGNTGWVGK